MKKIAIFIFTILLSIAIFAQAPQSFKYQSVVRDANGNVIQNQAVDFRISILQTSSTGTPVYIETFSTSTNNFGLVNLNIGTGTVLSGTFSSIDWGTDNYFLQVEIDPDGNGYQLMGTSQLLSVPYALNAAKADNVNNSDTSATNELQTLSQTGTDVSLSNGGGTISVADNDNDSTNEIQAISFSGDTLYLSNGSSVYLGNYSNIWQQNGNDIYYNNGYVGVGLTDPHGKLIVQGDASIPADSAIFEVRNQNGQVVFAVYQEGVRVYVDDTGTKGISSKGGFAVGGFNATKSLTNEYLRVTPDSVRVYIEEGSGSKAIHSKGGFAIGGFNATKTSFNGPQYFNVSASDTAGIIPMPGEARVMWYPLKEAFLSGHVIVESPDSIGLNSMATGYESKAIGNYSQALGYRAIASGDNSTSMGYNSKSSGNNSYSFGNYALSTNEGSYAIGTGSKALGLRSFALGSVGVDSAGNSTSPTIASGDYSYAFGMGSVASSVGAFAFGTQDTASGRFSLAMGYKTKAEGWFATSMGYSTKAIGWYSLALGYKTKATGGYSFAFGDSAVSGWRAVAMGTNAKANGSNSIALGCNVFTPDSGQYSIAIGNGVSANNWNSMAIGTGVTANGWWAAAIGNYATANASHSIALGYKSTTDGWGSVAIGEDAKAIGSSAVSIGYQSTALGNVSFVAGHGSKANSFLETVFGRFNDTTVSVNIHSWVPTEPLFIIGNGTNDTLRHNALTVLKNGNLGINTNTPYHLVTINASDDSLALCLIGPYSSGYGAMLNFGDSNNVFIQEFKNDFLKIHADSNIVFETSSGNVGVNTNTPDKLLTVNGDARITGDIYYGVIGSGTTYNKPDFVFKPDYKKNFNIDYIEKYINRHGHLPWLTAAKDEKDGINMTRMSFETLEAVENQQLQIIQLRKEKDKQINALKKENQKLKSENKEILKRLEKIEKQLKSK